MKTIDTTKPILVTGANGYVASWLVKKLLDNGNTVHATVRDSKNEEKIKHLLDLGKTAKGKLVLFDADLLTEGSFTRAMEGCELVYHTASPFTSNISDPVKELIEPAVSGTENVLNTAKQIESVKRVVVTSSCAAMYTDAIDTLNAPKGKLTEEVWNTTSSIEYQPYMYSKTMAEKKAWEIENTQSNWDLITINMCLVLGPALNPKHITSESFNILKMFGNGEMKMGAPKIGMGIVDVRDVAEAHFRAGFTPEAKGRYITAAHETDFLEMGLVLQSKYGSSYPLPQKALPKWLLMIIGPITNKLFTRKFIRNNVNIEWKADNSKIKEELNMTFRPLKVTMEDSFQNIIDEKLI